MMTQKHILVKSLGRVVGMMTTRAVNTLATVSLGTLLVMASHAQNLIYNGDFELGNVGFYTEYDFSSVLLPAGTYTITNNPRLHHYLAASYADHTPDPGHLMMMFNGATTPNRVVWRQTVSSIAANQLYHFSMWVSSWTATNPARLQVDINGSVLGVATAPSVAGVWQQYSFTWFSGSSTTATITILGLSTASGGNDFALDDLEFVPEPASMVALGTGLVSLLGLRRRRQR